MSEWPALGVIRQVQQVSRKPAASSAASSAAMPTASSSRAVSRELPPSHFTGVVSGTRLGAGERSKKRTNNGSSGGGGSLHVLQ